MHWCYRHQATQNTYCTLKSCTIIRDEDQWYCCITTDDGIVEKQEPKLIQNAVGIDKGIVNLMALSTDEMIENPRYIKRAVDNIKTLQRSLSRKEKGSHTREKARIQLAKAWRKVRNQRLDYCHKKSAKLATRFDTIVFEDLKINNMVRNHNVAQAIMDATWGMLSRITTYKVERRGGRIIVVNPDGTSQKCSRCGVVKEGEEKVIRFGRKYRRNGGHRRSLPSGRPSRGLPVYDLHLNTNFA